MDLSRIEAWTRTMLEAEARRRRIRSPEFRTRSELVRLILKHQYGDQLSAGRERVAQGLRTLEQARGTLATLIGSALSHLPEPFETLLGTRRPSHAPREQAAPNVEPAPPTPPAPPARPAARAQRARLEKVQPLAAPPASKPEAPGPVASTRTFVEEPIRTHSMARLLATQGHRERALAIYEELLAQNSEDETLRREADAVRHGRPVAAPPPPEPKTMPEPIAAPAGPELLACDGEPRSGLRVRWQITDAGQQRARALLGGAGELAVRLVVIRPDPELVVRSEITEHGPVGAEGAWQTQPLPEAARCFAAIGLRDGDRFVAIAHAHPEMQPDTGAAAAPVQAAAG